MHNDKCDRRSCQGADRVALPVFPDKAAIVQALTMRYMGCSINDLQSYTPLKPPVCPYRPMYQVIDATAHLFSDHPGYHAIFMQVQGTMPELEAIETATDAQLIQNLAIFLSQYYSGLDHADYEAIAFVLVKDRDFTVAVPRHEKIFRQRLVAETKRLTLSYLQSYLMWNAT